MEPSEEEYYQQAVDALEEHEPDTFVLAFVQDGDDGPRTIHQDGSATPEWHCTDLLGAMISSISRAIGYWPEKTAIRSYEDFMEKIETVQSSDHTILD